ncbi:hypothetical protein, partial [Pseudomonas aeruginosa]|uniref:hypothetical protein n=1 Tax=Pseudomonas aeruginosa TaxID=287 RepID=UPI001C984B9E
ARYAVGRCLMLWSSNDVTQQGSRPKTKLEAKAKLVVRHRARKHNHRIIAALLNRMVAGQ